VDKKGDIKRVRYIKKGRASEKLGLNIFTELDSLLKMNC
jgi:hypothetical protein